jgi:hypothetical protein
VSTALAIDESIGAQLRLAAQVQQLARVEEHRGEGSRQRIVSLGRLWRIGRREVTTHAPHGAPLPVCLANTTRTEALQTTHHAPESSIAVAHCASLAKPLPIRCASRSVTGAVARDASARLRVACATDGARGASYVHCLSFCRRERRTGAPTNAPWTADSVVSTTG